MTTTLQRPADRKPDTAQRVPRNLRASVLEAVTHAAQIVPPPDEAGPRAGERGRLASLGRLGLVLHGVGAGIGLSEALTR
jgi:hypothetical protein